MKKASLAKFFAFSQLLLFLILSVPAVQVWAQAPTISSFSPASGNPGTLVTITGTNLGSPTAFTIGGTAAIVVSKTATKLVGMVMPGSATGLISVTNASGTVSGTGNFTIKTTIFPTVQQGSKLVGTGNTGAAQQGISVAVSADGNTAIVGGPVDNANRGAVWIYTRSGGSWTQQGTKLTGTGFAGTFSNQGVAVALSADGNTAIVGGALDNDLSGAAWVFTRSGTTWTQQGSKLVGTGAVGSAQQGSSVSLSADGNTALVGGPTDNTNIGAVWIYTRSGSTWTQQGSKLVGTGAVGSAQQGWSVSLSADGNTAITGGRLDNSNAGAAWVYTRSGTTWTQQGAKLVGTGAVGASQQGYSVAISANGNTAMVGASQDNTQAGAAWVYTRSGTTWTQQGTKLVGTGAVGAAQQGWSVSLSADGNTASVGGYADNSAVGAAWVYTRSGTTWTQGSKLVGTGTVGAAQQGVSVSMSADGNTAMVCAAQDNTQTGAAWVYAATTTTTITSISPASGTTLPGTSVTLTGVNFNTTAANNIVYFGAAKANVTAASATSLTVTAPVGATYAPVTALNTALAQAGTSPKPFLPTFAGKGSLTANDILAKVDFATGTTQKSVAIGDLDGDGKPDLAVAAGANRVSVFRNTSASGSITASSFAARVDFTTGTSPASVAIGDLDGDGKLDLVVANFTSNSVSIFRNTSASGSITASSFAAKVDFTTGTSPQSVAIGDLDGDGKPDLAVANAGSASVSIFRNNFTSGSITASSFAAKVDFATGTSPYSVAIGDLDGDGKPDLAVANSGANSVSIFRNTSASGSITASSFAAKVDFATGTAPQSVAIGDLDGDGKPDLAVANDNNVGSVSVFRNTSLSGSISASSFAAKVDFATGSNPESVAIGDLDGDGKPDLAVAIYGSNSVSVFRNTSTSGSITASSFAANVDFTTGTSPWSVAIGDLDGDGKPDLAVGHYNSFSVSVFRNNPSAFISFNANGGTGAMVNQQISYLASANLTANAFTRTGYTFSGWNTAANGSGTAYANGSSYTMGAGNVILYAQWAVNTYSITFNGNGSDGGAMSAQSIVYNTSANLSSNGFTRTGYSFSGWNTAANGSGIAYVNGSSYTMGAGNVILYAQWAANTYTITFIGNGSDGGVMSAQSIVYNTFSPLTANSFARTGYIFAGWNTAANGSGTAYANGVNYTMAAPANVTLYAQWTINTYSITFNGNGSDGGAMSAQLIPYNTSANLSSNGFTRTGFSFVGWNTATNGSGTVYANGASYLIGAGDVTLYAQWASTSTITSISPGFGATVPGATVTIIGTNFNPTAASNIVMFGSVKATVTAATATSLTVTAPLGASYERVTALNTASGLTATSSIPFLNSYSPNKGLVTTADIAAKVDFATLAGSAPFAMASGDLDGDGKVDIAVVNESLNTVSVYKNTSTGGTVSFAAKVDFVTGTKPNGIAIGDLDGDGKLDMVVANFGGNSISVYKNTSSSGTISASSFAAKLDIATGQNPLSPVILDLDGNGRPEIAVVNYYGNSVSVYQNNTFTGILGLGSFSTKVDFATGGSPFSLAIGDLDGDGKPDMAVANSNFFNGNTVSVLRNTNSGAGITSALFAAKVDFATGAIPISVSIGDLDGNGKSDLAVANYYSNSVSVLRNTATSGSIAASSFAAKVDFATGVAPYCVRLGDIDGNGKPDLVVANNTGNTVSVLRNASTSGSIVAASFVAKVDFAAGTNPRTLAICDFNMDGKADIATASWALGTVSVLRNNPTYSITYNGNGSTAGAVPVAGAFPISSTITVAANTGALVRTGFVFSGWNTNATGTGTAYAASGVATLVLNANTILYAKWVPGLVMSPIGEESIRDSIVSQNSDLQFAKAGALATGVGAGVQENSKAFSIMPNPMEKEALVRFESKGGALYKLHVINSLGQLVYSTDGRASEGVNAIELNLEKLSSGLYIVQLVQDGSRQQVNLIKK
jgi:uncharacterized repeat protein (TIGR02543 family)